MLRADEIRDQQRQMWDRFSPGWMKWDALAMEMLAPVGAEMIGALALRDGSEHLDIASGTGEPGLSIAELIPRGRVVLTDLSGGMLAAAIANATARGLANVETRECDHDHLPVRLHVLPRHRRRGRGAAARAPAGRAGVDRSVGRAIRQSVGDHPAG